jgi:hypothetical protein
MPRLSTPLMVPTPSVMFLPGMKVPGGDHADAQTIGVRMLLGRDHPRDGER